MNQLQTAKQQEIDYPFVVSWLHTSIISYKGNKHKANFFNDKEKALRFFAKMTFLQEQDATYFSGYITYLAKNF